MQNPFQALYDAGTNIGAQPSILQRDAATLAQAFLNAHPTTGFSDMDQVWAIIRFARQLGLLSGGDYLQGRFFTAWVDHHGDPLDLGALREAAWEFAQRVTMEASNVL